jgi:RNase P protein component
VTILNNFHGLKIKNHHGFDTIFNHNFNKTNTSFTFYLFFLQNPRCTAREEKKYGSFGKKVKRKKYKREGMNLGPFNFQGSFELETC